jgi:hypothetical protein
MAIQIGKYKRPGIFLEEYDNSIIATPIVEGITNLVIGVSRKGPVNTPVRITTISDLESVFGTLDRGLERKGSYFHRTAAKMLESSPIFAMNLLVTDDTLDTLEYKSISASSNLTNDMERLGAYRRFHDTTGFWRRDTDSFISLTKSNLGNTDRVINLTNLSDRYATVFIFNSQVSGFDRTLIEWYGSQEKVPTYLNSNDWASDYMVDVVIIAGDWSDYRTLAVDPRWSAYFNANGLRREQVRNFAQDRNVTTLAFYEGLSLIPYFRDANGRNVFIETTINRDTDKTGIFCAFNNDLVEEDFYNGKIDIIGHTIAGTNKESIEFLSYQEDIMEEVTFTTTPLDLPGNVTTLVGDYAASLAGNMFGTHTFANANGPRTSGLQVSETRTTYFAEEFISNVWQSSTASVSSGPTFSVKYKVGNKGGYAIISDNKIDLNKGVVELVVNGTDFATSSVSKNYSAAFVLDSSGTLKPVVNTSEYKSTADLPAVESTDIVLGYATFSVQYQNIGNIGLDTVTLGFTSSIDPDNYKYNFLVPTTDYTITSVSDGVIKVSFTNTNDSPGTSRYTQYRKFKMFNRLVNLLSSANISKMALLTNKVSGYKVSMAGMSISDIETSTTKDKSFVLNTGLTNTVLDEVISKKYLALYTVDNELILGRQGLNTTNEIAGATFGVVARYSDLYSKFYGGQINTGDFFYNNRIGTASWTGVTDLPKSNITFVPGETSNLISGFNTGITTIFAGNDYVVFTADPKFTLNEKFRVSGAGINTGIFTIVSGALNATTFGAPGKFIYQVNENTTYEVLSDIDYIQEIGNNLHYLKMYIDESEKMSISFLDSTLSGTASLVDWTNGIGDPGSSSAGVKSSTTFYVNSEDTNYKQTLEIEAPTGYVEQPNKVLVLASRYPEVLKGDFLEADYDETLLAVGEVPRKMTRILNKTQYAANTTYMEITCDAKIKKVYTGAAYQTTRYKKVDNYVETYKAISLKGFRIRQASMPDGTETRQNQILNIVAKGTPLFKALTNKEAIDFRYLVDTFGNGLTEKSKQQLVDICGDRLDAFGFINMPSIKQFKNSSSPSFTNAEGVLQAEFIAKGADPASGPAFYYGFGEGSGSTTVGYFLPYVTINDNGRPMEFPPASYVAATYMRKHNAGQGAITPWTIAAGVTNGRITGINGLEIDFTPSDIEFLNGAQMNPLVFKRNRGHIIETENTAQTLFKSALSYIHVREVLIELERELSRMLLDFQWRFNTADTRSEIKLRADVICESYVSRVGLYNYFNKMDEENNTTEIIDNQIGVLDTYVEPIKGMGIIVNNVTILRTGAIAAGGFL